MKLYQVKMTVNKKGNGSRVDVHSNQEKLVVGNLETAEVIYNDYMNTLLFQTKCMKKFSGYVAIFEPEVDQDGTVTDRPVNGEYIKLYQC